MNTSIITSRLLPIIGYAKRYRVILFALFLLGMYGFLIYQISVLSQSEPDPATVSESLSTVKRLQIDQESIDKVLELEEQNVEVKTLFQQARQNPFNE
jgi:hypothetical protein